MRLKILITKNKCIPLIALKTMAKFLCMSPMLNKKEMEYIKCLKTVVRKHNLLPICILLGSDH